ncbi:MAG: hypothetical protein JHD25_09060 [Sphingomonadaceae bacterium]|nr:hypothetical protein [Sphingomonadaceae bacterium]MBJ7389530.1 hypothetical protein [Sphingomonadaceae bacterium]MBJ7527203.1 hypothetical protein [Sphingomonadaceae bacterium]
MMKTRAALALTLSILSGPVMAAPADADKPVATLVVVKTPPGVSREMIEAGFVKAVPVYEKIPGLLRKYFTVNDAGFGGMYLWKNRSAANAWYSSEWRARVKATYGVEPEVTYFDSPLQIDNTVSKSR